MGCHLLGDPHAAAGQDAGVAGGRGAGFTRCDRHRLPARPARSGADRALIGLMVYTFSRVGAAVAMRVEDYFDFITLSALSRAG
jgi:hypothetical protein